MYLVFKYINLLFSIPKYIECILFSILQTQMTIKREFSALKLLQIQAA